MTSTPRAIAALTVMALFFGSNLVIGRPALETIGPWTLAFLRWLVAFLLILPFTARGLMDHKAALIAAGWELALAAFLGMVVCGAGVYIALAATTATNSTLIYTVSPVMVLLIERFAFGKTLTTGRILGVVMAIAGVAVIVLRGNPAALLSLHLNPGDVGIFAAAFGWALYTLVLRRPRLTAVPGLPLFAATAAIGALELAPGALLETLSRGTVPHTMREGALVGALALFSSTIAFSCYQYGVRVLGPAITACFLYLMPLFGVLMATLLLGEELHPYHAVGMALILPGLVAATVPSQTLIALISGKKIAPSRA